MSLPEWLPNQFGMNNSKKYEKILFLTHAETVLGADALGRGGVNTLPPSGSARGHVATRGMRPSKKRQNNNENTSVTFCIRSTVKLPGPSKFKVCLLQLFFSTNRRKTRNQMSCSAAEKGIR